MTRRIVALLIAIVVIALEIGWHWYQVIHLREIARGVRGQTEFQVNLKLGLTPRRLTPRRLTPRRLDIIVLGQGLCDCGCTRIYRNYARPGAGSSKRQPRRTGPPSPSSRERGPWVNRNPDPFGLIAEGFRSSIARSISSIARSISSIARSISFVGSIARSISFVGGNGGSLPRDSD